MSYRQTQNMTMNGLKSHDQQRGIGQWWMILTIGIMVGFVFGFILFLSRLPDDNYTLVETERGIEQIEATDAEQYAFYDRLAEEGSAVPNVEANDMPAHSRTRSAGGYGANDNERPTAVKIADDLRVGADVAPIEIAASSAVVGGAVANGSTRTVNSISGNSNSVARQQTPQPTVIKKVPGAPSTSYYLQAGAFVKDGDAQRLRRRLNQSGMDAFIKKVAIDGTQWHRVRLGPFYDARSLGSAKSRLGSSGISYMVIKVQS